VALRPRLSSGVPFQSGDSTLKGYSVIVYRSRQESRSGLGIPLRSLVTCFYSRAAIMRQAASARALRSAQDRLRDRPGERGQNQCWQNVPEHRDATDKRADFSLRSK
jgi:hypothetical protein